MIKKIINNLKSNYNSRAYTYGFFSILISLAYSIYNGILGVVKLSIWNGSICFYYLLLLFLKTVLINERKNDNDNKKRKRMILLSYLLLFIITIAMITPAILMINNKRTYNFGLIPAIAMATYTTYSITMAIIKFNKAKNDDNQVIKQMRLLNIVSAMMSVIVLQNTLILANGEINAEMQTLSIYTSFAIIISTAAMIIVQMTKFIKSVKGAYLSE